MTSTYDKLRNAKGAPQVAGALNATQINKAPMNLRSAMQKYARGGDVKNFSSSNVSLDNYSNYSAKQNHEYRNIPDVGDNILLFWDHPNKRVVVSDEGYWNKDSPVGKKLTKAVEWAHNQGYQAGVVVSPYSSDRFGDGVTTTAGGQPRKTPGATDQQLRDYIDAADFVVTDPYVVSQATATPEMQDNFANFTKNVGDYANEKGKDSWLFLQGFGTKDVDPKIVEDYNNRLATENAGRYNDISFFNLSDFGFAPGESVETFGDTIYQLNTKGAVDAATQAAQPFKMAEKTGLDLPADWNSYGAKDKIDWFNEKNVSPDVLATSGVAQGDIDWMMQNGYTGNTAQQQPQRMAMQAQPQEMTGIAALGGDGKVPPRPTPPDLVNPYLVERPTVTGYEVMNKAPPQLVTPLPPQTPPPPIPQVTPVAPDYSRANTALGGAEVVNDLRNQFLGMGVDENTIGSIFSKYYS